MDLHHFSATVFSKLDKVLNFQSFEIHNSICFENVPGVLLICLGVLVSPKIKYLVLEAEDTSPNPEIIEMRVFRFCHEQIEKFLNQMEQNNPPELLSLLFQ